MISILSLSYSGLYQTNNLEEMFFTILRLHRVTPDVPCDPFSIRQYSQSETLDSHWFCLITWWYISAINILIYCRNQPLSALQENTPQRTKKYNVHGFSKKLSGGTTFGVWWKWRGQRRYICSLHIINNNELSSWHHDLTIVTLQTSPFFKKDIAQFLRILSACTVCLNVKG